MSVVDTSMGQLAAKIASEHKLRGADAIYVATAQRLDVALISWDHEQLARASSIITTTHPPAEIEISDLANRHVPLPQQHTHLHNSNALHGN